jgi:hypothetical protein
MTLDDYVDKLEQFGFQHFILIERRNHLQRIVSILRGHQSAQWHHIEGSSGTESVSASTATSKAHSSVNQIALDVDQLSLNWGTDVEPRSLIAHLEHHEQAVNQLREVLSRRQLLSLTYEDDIKNQPTEAYRRICEFLGLGPQPVEVRFQKTNPHPLSEVVTNFSEVQRRLQGTRFAWMLDPSFD